MFVYFILLLWVICGLKEGKEYFESKADEGLVFCKLGGNYVWLTPQEFERLRMTERSE
jgi:hypothetical protein